MRYTCKIMNKFCSLSRIIDRPKRVLDILTRHQGVKKNFVSSIGKSRWGRELTVRGRITL